MADGPEEEAFFTAAAMITNFPSPPATASAHSAQRRLVICKHQYSVSCDDQATSVASASFASATACCEPAIYAFGWSCMAGWLDAQLLAMAC